MNDSSSPMVLALSSTLFISLLDSARQLQISEACNKSGLSIHRIGMRLYGFWFYSNVQLVK
jgi:hypothetical protein